MKTEETYFCTGCKNLTSTPVFIEEGDTGASLIFCPHCGSGSVKSVQACSFCRGLFEDCSGEEPICPVCKEDLKNRFQKIMAVFFTPEEKDVLNKIYEGDCF